MKKIFIMDHNNVLVDLRDIFEVVYDVDLADVVCLWQDVLGIEKGVANLAKMRRKPVVICQHGRNATVDYGPPMNYPLMADKICVWGPKDVERLREFGIPSHKIELTGTMVLSHLKPREKHNGINIVFRPAHWDVQVVQENFVLRDILRKIKGVNLITKTMEAHRLEDFDNPVASYRDELGHLDICANVLAKADVVVGTAEEGTFEMMAYALDIPVILLDYWEPKSFLGREIVPLIHTEACDVVEKENFEKAIWNAINNSQYKKEERKKIAYQEGGIGLPGDPRDNIAQVINSL